MEKRLSKWFALAENWGVVILIDEADVYLEKRQATDLKRNSLVAGKSSTRSLLELFIDTNIKGFTNC